MSGSLFENFNIEVLFDEHSRPWFKRAHVGKFLGLKHIDTSISDLDESESCTRNDLRTTYDLTRNDLGSVLCAACVWFRPKDQHNKTDVFLSIYGVIYVITYDYMLSHMLSYMLSHTIYDLVISLLDQDLSAAHDS